MKNTKQLFAGLAAIFTLTACGVASTVPPTIIYRDSTHVEYRDRVVHDTVEFQMPDYLAERTTPDTLSIIENDYARTVATVHDGLLSHSLRTKPVIIEIPVTSVVTDTLVIREKGEERTVVRTVEVEKKLTVWQTWQMTLGRVALVALAILALWLIAKKVLKV